VSSVAEPVTVQYRIAVGKKDEIVVGPAEAEVVVTVAKADCHLDPTIAYMQGKLKSTGPTGPLLDLLASGAAAEVLTSYA